MGSTKGHWGFRQSLPRRPSLKAKRLILILPAAAPRELYDHSDLRVGRRTARLPTPGLLRSQHLVPSQWLADAESCRRDPARSRRLRSGPPRSRGLSIRNSLEIRRGAKPFGAPPRADRSPGRPRANTIRPSVPVRRSGRKTRPKRPAIAQSPKPCGFSDCQRHVSTTMSSIPNRASQPSSAFARAGSA